MKVKNTAVALFTLCGLVLLNAFVGAEEIIEETNTRSAVKYPNGVDVLGEKDAASWSLAATLSKPIGEWRSSRKSRRRKRARMPLTGSSSLVERLKYKKGDIQVALKALIVDKDSPSEINAPTNSAAGTNGCRYHRHHWHWHWYWSVGWYHRRPIFYSSKSTSIRVEASGGYSDAFAELRNKNKGSAWGIGMSGNNQLHIGYGALNCMSCKRKLITFRSTGAIQINADVRFHQSMHGLKLNNEPIDELETLLQESENVSSEMVDTELPEGSDDVDAFDVVNDIMKGVKDSTDVTDNTAPSKGAKIAKDSGSGNTNGSGRARRVGRSNVWRNRRAAKSTAVNGTPIVHRVHKKKKHKTCHWHHHLHVTFNGNPNHKWTGTNSGKAEPAATWWSPRGTSIRLESRNSRRAQEVYFEFKNKNKGWGVGMNNRFSLDILYGRSGTMNKGPTAMELNAKGKVIHFFGHVIFLKEAIHRDWPTLLELGESSKEGSIDDMDTPEDEVAEDDAAHAGPSAIMSHLDSMEHPKVDYAQLQADIDQDDEPNDEDYPAPKTELLEDEEETSESETVHDEKLGGLEPEGGSKWIEDNYGLWDEDGYMPGLKNMRKLGPYDSSSRVLASGAHRAEEVTSRGDSKAGGAESFMETGEEATTQRGFKTHYFPARRGRLARAAMHRARWIFQRRKVPNLVVYRHRDVSTVVQTKGKASAYMEFRNARGRNSWGMGSDGKNFVISFGKTGTMAKRYRAMEIHAGSNTIVFHRDVYLNGKVYVDRENEPERVRGGTEEASTMVWPTTMAATGSISFMSGLGSKDAPGVRTFYFTGAFAQEFHKPPLVQVFLRRIDARATTNGRLSVEVVKVGTTSFTGVVKTWLYADIRSFGVSYVAVGRDGDASEYHKLSEWRHRLFYVNQENTWLKNQDPEKPFRYIKFVHKIHVRWAQYQMAKMKRMREAIAQQVTAMNEFSEKEEQFAKNEMANLESMRYDMHRQVRKIGEASPNWQAKIIDLWTLQKKSQKWLAALFKQTIVKFQMARKDMLWIWNSISQHRKEIERMRFAWKLANLRSSASEVRMSPKTYSMQVGDGLVKLCSCPSEKPKPPLLELLDDSTPVPGLFSDGEVESSSDESVDALRDDQTALPSSLAGSAGGTNPYSSPAPEDLEEIMAGVESHRRAGAHGCRCGGSSGTRPHHARIQWRDHPHKTETET